MTTPDNESAIIRPKPTILYRATSAVLRVPPLAIEATLQALRRQGRVETCCFWFGERDASGNGIVQAVGVPRQRGTWGNYFVPADAMGEMLAALPREEWRTLAQIHSHPGVSVEHSFYDDRMASSRRALSIVFPNYGHWHAPWPSGTGVHEHQAGYWYLLKADQAAQRVWIEAGDAVIVKDLRS